MQGIGRKNKAYLEQGVDEEGRGEGEFTHLADVLFDFSHEGCV